jgi:O-antigen ligase
MPPEVAFTLVTAFVVCILFADSRRKPAVSWTLWIPTIWAGVLSSRPVSAWFEPAVAFGANVEDGSPVDRLFLSFLIALAIITLMVRRLEWSKWVRANWWLVLFFVYCGISTVWSDYPLVGLKRWFRALGSLAMVLVVVSDDDPIRGVRTIVRRCAYILVPFSIVLIKYFRDLGVAYDYWTGAETLVGATVDKNALGRLCLVASLFAVWEFVVAKNDGRQRTTLINKSAGIVVLVMSLWLLIISDSATSLVTFLVGATVIAVLGISFIRNRVRHLGTMVVLGIGTAAVAGLSFGLAESAVASLGRNLTLTDRTFIWQDILDTRTNPFVGVGYDTFWLGERLDRFVSERKVSSAHNGYLDAYIELGGIGLVLFVGLLFNVFRVAKRSLLSTAFDYGRLRIALLIIFALYNITESGYKLTTFICFTLFLVAMDVPALVQSAQNAEAPVAPQPRSDETFCKSAQPRRWARTPGPGWSTTNAKYAGRVRDGRFPPS